MLSWYLISHLCPGLWIAYDLSHVGGISRSLSSGWGAAHVRMNHLSGSGLDRSEPFVISRGWAPPCTTLLHLIDITQCQVPRFWCRVQVRVYKCSWVLYLIVACKETGEAWQNIDVRKGTIVGWWAIFADKLWVPKIQRRVISPFQSKPHRNSVFWFSSPSTLPLYEHLVVLLVA